MTQSREEQLANLAKDMRSDAQMMSDPRILFSYASRIEAILAQPLAPAQQETLADEPNGVPLVTGETSDGYHTFNELYEHRHALFSVVCAAFGGWKSMLHENGTMFDGWFIAGVMTPKGMATYHLPLEWWPKFKAHIVRRAPHWDGHTAQQVPERIASLAAAPQPAPATLEYRCTQCGMIGSFPAKPQFEITPEEEKELAELDKRAKWVQSPAAPAEVTAQQFETIDGEQQTQAMVVRNLAMLVRRLAHRLPKDDAVAKKALDYLLGEGLQGNPLRDAASGPSSTGE